MRNELRTRLESLRADFEKGHARLRDLQMQQSQLQEKLLRIEGAIVILEELLSREPEGAEGNGGEESEPPG